jgi:hypothetical protein
MPKLGHVHVGVRDLGGAVQWFEKVFDVSPQVQNERIAWLRFESFGVILDAAAADSKATLGFESVDCDGDFAALVGRGAQEIEKPANRPWGARVAYLKGPGELTIEFEEFLGTGS